MFIDCIVMECPTHGYFHRTILWASYTVHTVDRVKFKAYAVARERKIIMENKLVFQTYLVVANPGKTQKGTM